MAASVYCKTVNVNLTLVWRNVKKVSLTNDSFVHVSISVNFEQIGCISIKVNLDLNALV